MRNRTFPSFKNISKVVLQQHVCISLSHRDDMCWAHVDSPPSVGRCGLLRRGSNTEHPSAKHNLDFSLYVSSSLSYPLFYVPPSLPYFPFSQFTLYHSSINHMSTLHHQQTRTHSPRGRALSEDDKHVHAHRPSVRQCGGRISCTHIVAHAKETLPKQKIWAVPLHCNRDFMLHVYFQCVWVCE